MCLYLLSNNNLHKDQLFDSKSAEFYGWIEVILSIWRSVCQTSRREKTKMCVFFFLKLPVNQQLQRWAVKDTTAKTLK